MTEELVHGYGTAELPQGLPTGKRRIEGPPTNGAVRASPRPCELIKLSM